MQTSYFSKWLFLFSIVIGFAGSITSVCSAGDTNSQSSELKRIGWNSMVKQRFMYPPVFEFEPRKDIVTYRTTISWKDADANETMVLKSREAKVDFEKAWKKLPAAGRLHVCTEGIDSKGRISGKYDVDCIKIAGFTHSYRSSEQNCMESGSRAAVWVTGQAMNNGRGYPGLFWPSYIGILTTYARLNPQSESTQRALETAKQCGEALLKSNTPADWVYPNIPYSHKDFTQIGRAAMAGMAYLNLFEATKEQRYTEAANLIAETLVKTQLPDGRWYFRVEPKTGKVVEDYTSDQAEAILLLDELACKYDQKKFIASRDKAVKWMLDNPCKTFLWQQQWDDVGTIEPYKNLEWYDTGLFCEYLLKKATKENEYEKIATELLRYIEDQFVEWEPDVYQLTPRCKPDHGYITPGVREQYLCYTTIDWHAAHFIRLCMAWYSYSKDKIYLEKAKALADTLAYMQHNDGYYPTWMEHNSPSDNPQELGEINYGDIWANCTSYSGEMLMKLAEFTRQTSPAAVGKAVEEEIKLPLINYTSTSSCNKLQSIEDTGYFEIGRRYVHAPLVEWIGVKEAAYYKIVLIQYDKILGVTTSKDTRLFAENGWDKIKPGKAGVSIIGYDRNNKRVAISRLFPFYVAPDFQKDVSAKQKRSYREAAIRAFECLYNFNYNKDAKPNELVNPVVTACLIYDNTLNPMAYPNLHDWQYADMCEQMYKFDDEELRMKIVVFANSVGKHLLMCRVQEPNYAYSGMIRGATRPDGSAMIGFNAPEDQKAKAQRLIEPSKCAYSGMALIKIYKLTGNAEYLNAARRIASVLADKQLEDGSWYARVDGLTGETLGGTYSTSVIAAAGLMDMLNSIEPDEKWVRVRQKAVEWMVKNPFRTHGWVLNFDDGQSQSTAGNHYKGLSNWDLFEAIRYLDSNPQTCVGAKTIVIDQMRWNDNHFVFYGSDPLLPWEPYYPVCGEQGDPKSFVSIWDCWLPMDFHTANWGKALIAAYKVTGSKEYLEKATAAANALTQYQVDNGMTITWMMDKYSGVSAHILGNCQGEYNLWPSAAAMSASFWAELVNMGID